MIEHFFIFVGSLFLVIKGATVATKYAALLAESFRLSKYTVGFIIVAVISILPEMLISINAALEGVPSFGLAVLFAGNVADLTLLFALITSIVGRGIKVESAILKNNRVFPLLLLLPLVLGFDGHFSRLDGITLMIAGGVFYYLALKKGVDGSTIPQDGSGRMKNTAFLVAAMAALLVGSHFTVTSATGLANDLGIPPLLIGVLVVGLGTTVPEFLFSLNAVKKRHDALALGDILGTVLADATVVVGLLAIVSPFTFPLRIILIPGVFMVGASLLLFSFMRSRRMLSRKEAWLLLGFWLLFVVVEFVTNRA